MNLLKRSMSLFLLLAFSGLLMMPAIAEDKTPTESRQERRFFKKFDRKFTEFQLNVDELLEEYNEVEMKEMYQDMIIYLEQNGHYEMAKVMMAVHDKSKGSIRTRMIDMSSEQARIEAKAILKDEILKAGGFKAFMAAQKITRSQNVDKKCRAKKIVSYALIAPVTYIGMMTGLAGVGALVSGSFTATTAAWLGTAVVADGILFPQFLNNMVVGCYIELSHPDFTYVNR